MGRLQPTSPGCTQLLCQGWSRRVSGGEGEPPVPFPNLSGRDTHGASLPMYQENRVRVLHKSMNQKNKKTSHGKTAWR